MEPAVGAESHGARGRVVMLVDNGVNGDSRVQKAARSAAEAGWEVILLGHSSDGQPKVWQLGKAEVRLLPVPTPLSKRPHEFRRSWLRGPLAYPPNGIAAYRLQRYKARQADLRLRSAALTLAVRSRPARLLSLASRIRLKIRRRVLRAELRWAKVHRWWVLLRYREVSRVRNARRGLDGPWDRLYTYFWQTILGDRSWRRLEPRLYDYELAYGRVIDDLKPDLIHANDFRMLGVGARATIRARAARRSVKLVWDAHEFLPGLNQGSNSARWLPALCAYEREYAPFADAVITVSEGLADLLQTGHKLADRPTVVLNAPNSAADETDVDDRTPDLRVQCGVDDDTPLLVYSGGVAPVRGVDIMVEALPALPRVHIALVSMPPGKTFTRHINELLARATELGVASRVHVLPYVPHWRVASFLSAADAAVSPLHHLPNHEIALSNKFFEYSHARLPMVISDVRTMADTTRSVGQGEVFRAGDVEDYVRAVKAVLADPQRYRGAYDREGMLESWTWEAQSKVLDEVYTRLLPTFTSDPDGGIRTMVPDVSVIIAVHNAMPYFTKCIRSLLEQSIGMDHFEVIAVDDGSTDGSGERIVRFAQLYPNTFKVIRQANSGGPAAPSNRGLEMARGRYVFFLGADDYLGPEALERMVAAADERGSDVLLVRMVGVNGRWVPRDIFADTDTDTDTDIDLFNSALPFALSNTKLFRRDLIEKHQLRYPENLPVGSDQPFTLEACVRAERISVLADYDYYYAVRRRNDGNITYRASPEERLRCTAEIMAFTATLVEPGVRREAINHRHFASELSKLLLADFLDLDGATQARICAGIGQLVEQHYTDAIAARIDVGLRLRLALAHRGDLDALLAVIRQETEPEPVPIVVDGDRLYYGYKGFRDSQLSLPDDLFHITDSPAESVATQLGIVAVEWGQRDGTRVLTVTLHSPVDLTRLGQSPVRMTVGQVVARVALDAATEGTVVRAEFDLDQLLAELLPLGDRRQVRVQIDAGGTTCDVPIRVPSGARWARHLGRRGGHAYAIRGTSNRYGLLVIDYVPVTVHRIMGAARRRLRRVTKRLLRKGSNQA